MKRTYLFAIAIAIFFTGAVSAQDEDISASAAWQADVEAPPTQEEQNALVYDENALREYQTAYGEVGAVDAESRTITLLAYDYDREEEMGVLYKLAEDTEFEGADGLNDINPGDWVVINYHMGEDDVKIADFIAVEIEPLLEGMEPESPESGAAQEVQGADHGD